MHLRRPMDEEVRFIMEAMPGASPEHARHWHDALVRPLVRRLQGLVEAAQSSGQAPFVLSIGGLPGTGKSTLARILGAWFARSAGLEVAVLSLDDLYWGVAARQELARTLHPLFATRGVPGTHDVELGLELVRRLRVASEGQVTRLPRFDKLKDERSPLEQWPSCLGRPHLLIWEGWFWGARPGAAAALAAPLNRREAEEDPDGTWRRAVHRALGHGYPELFSCSDYHVQLAAPSHAKSVAWRIEQARHLRLARGLDPAAVDPAEVESFLQLFERVGRLPVPVRRGLLVELGDTHGVLRSEEVDGGGASSTATRKLSR